MSHNSVTTGSLTVQFWDEQDFDIDPEVADVFIYNGTGLTIANVDILPPTTKQTIWVKNISVDDQVAVQASGGTIQTGYVILEPPEAANLETHSVHLMYIDPDWYVLTSAECRISPLG